ncbi:MAG: hypothetical protein ABGX84_06340 [Alcanivorax sp.]|nr:hypothetical protein [Alcanivorax sp.]
MDWYYCGLDVQCWVTWLWSPTTAAWFQAIGSIFALIVAVGIAVYSDKRHAARARQTKQSMIIANSAKVARFQGLGLGFVEMLPIEEDATSDSVPFPRLKTTVDQIVRVTAALDQLIVQDSAHEDTSTHTAAYLIGAEQVLMILRDAITQARRRARGRRLEDMDIPIPPESRESLREQHRLMKAVCDASFSFVTQLSQSPDAEFPELDLPEVEELPSGSSQTRPPQEESS